MSVDTNRKIVVDGLLKVEKSGFSNLVFSSLIEQTNLSPQDKAFIAKVFYGTIERKLTLNYVLQKYVTKPLSKFDREVIAIMQSGLYQIMYMNSVPDFAAINQAVSLCPVFKKTSAKGLVNAVLRKAAKFKLEQEKFKSEIDMLSVKFSINSEILEIIMRDYPNQYTSILESMFVLPTLNINVNTVKISVEDYKQLLIDNNVVFSDTQLENCLDIHFKGGVVNIPGFNEGYFFVQGLTSSYCVQASGVKKGDKILDLCAAPGGKTFAAARILGNTGVITSCDPHSNRLALIEQGANRLGYTNINTVQNYGEVFNENFKEYDVVLCDVPCSGIGIIPKKPDLRYKDLGEIKELCKLQYEILKTASQYVGINGKIVYSTCTINKQENQEIINKFIGENNNFKLVNQNCPIQGVINNDNMITFLPNTTHCDGFFIAVLEKMC